MSNHNVNNYFVNRLRDEMEKSSRTRARISAKSRSRTRDRIEELEDEVYFANLVNRTIINVLTKRGLCTKEEFMELFAELDIQDGTIDGGSTGDDLAQEIGFEEMPIDRADEKKSAPIPSRKRRP